MPVTETGADAAARMVEQIGARAVHGKPAMHKISLLLLAGEKVVWARSGTKWKPRADGTKAGVLTGALKKSLTEADAEGAIREVHDDHMVFGTTLFQARFMQAGTKVNGAEHAPKRPVLVFRPTDRKASREIIRLHLLGELP